jgi:hypothetical protein
LAALAAVSGCAYDGGIDNPVVRKVEWFSYLDGADIRTYCVEGALDRYRLVYNARYDEQLRSYELSADGSGGAYMTARAMQKRGDLTEVTLDDVLAPWRWEKAERTLAPAEFQAFGKALRASGMYDGSPDGLRLWSDFHWAASGCRDGKFYAAWLSGTALSAAEIPGFPLCPRYHRRSGQSAPPDGRPGEIPLRRPRRRRHADEILDTGRREWLSARPQPVATAL